MNLPQLALSALLGTALVLQAVVPALRVLIVLSAAGFVAVASGVSWPAAGAQEPTTTTTVATVTSTTTAPADVAGADGSGASSGAGAGSRLPKCGKTPSTRATFSLDADPTRKGRFCTARSFLSQWSLRLTRAHGPRCLADTKLPVLNMGFTADQAVFPANVAEWTEAAGSRCTEYTVRGAGHYPQGKPELVEEIADTLVDWGG